MKGDKVVIGRGCALYFLLFATLQLFAITYLATSYNNIQRLLSLFENINRFIPFKLFKLPWQQSSDSSLPPALRWRGPAMTLISSDTKVGEHTLCWHWYRETKLLQSSLGIINTPYR